MYYSVRTYLLIMRDAVQRSNLELGRAVEKAKKEGLEPPSEEGRGGGGKGEGDEWWGDGGGRRRDGAGGREGLCRRPTRNGLSHQVKGPRGGMG